jgi:hypothetical protein
MVLVIALARPSEPHISDEIAQVTSALSSRFAGTDLIRDSGLHALVEDECALATINL